MAAGGWNAGGLSRKDFWNSCNNYSKSCPFREEVEVFFTIACGMHDGGGSM